MHQNVGREQVGRKLDSPEVSCQRTGHRFGQRSFTDTRHVLHQDGAIRQQGDHEEIERFGATTDYGRKILAQDRQGI